MEKNVNCPKKNHQQPASTFLSIDAIERTKKYFPHFRVQKACLFEFAGKYNIYYKLAYLA